jgi:3-dehydroquinate dehydratase
MTLTNNLTIKTMNTFNKYQFLADLQTELLDAVATNQIESEDQVWDWIHQAIDNEVIYYADCFAIIYALNFTDWSDTEFAPVTNVSIAAYSALYEFVNEELDLSAVNEAIASLEA